MPAREPEPSDDVRRRHDQYGCRVRRAQRTRPEAQRGRESARDEERWRECVDHLFDGVPAPPVKPITVSVQRPEAVERRPQVVSTGPTWLLPVTRGFRMRSRFASVGGGAHPQHGVADRVVGPGVEPAERVRPSD